MELYRISAEPQVPFWFISLVAYVRPFTILRNKWLLQVGRIIFFHTPAISPPTVCE